MLNKDIKIERKTIKNIVTYKMKWMKNKKIVQANVCN